MTEALVERGGHELTTRELHDLLELRIDVFVVEQHCPYAEIDGRDLEPSTTHMWLTDQAGVVATLRILDDGHQRRIGRVATRAEYRGRGLAGRLVGATLKATEGPVVLDAQSHLVDWYGRFGFEPTGEEFVEDGIPHVPMRLDRPAPQG
jgi:ElaA protein